jgi:hypothetical protein
MLNLAQVGSVLCVVSLVLAFSGGVADAGLSANCVAADGSTTSLLLLIKKKKQNHGDDDGGGQSELSECTIQSAGGGGGCKGGFKYVCEKMKSGKKCCGCVADKNAKSQQAPAQAGQKGEDNVLWGDYQQPQKAPPQTEQGTEKKGGTLLLPYCEEKGGQLVCTPQP